MAGSFVRKRQLCITRYRSWRARPFASETNSKSLFIRLYIEVLLENLCSRAYREIDGFVGTT